MAVSPGSRRSAPAVPATTNARRAPAARLIAWQKRHGRHDLPWQNTRDAYRVWLSEIMLQQTQVATVIPYYQRFLDRFPTIAALAGAPQDEVLALWSGLGYYSRARNLHRAAQLMVERHAGRMPSTPAEVEALPGIGRSTAAAICVFAYGGCHAILDGNVKRVLARYRGVAGDVGEARVAAALWREAEAMLPARHIEAYTQGLMDLGATVCARRQPQCERCPLNADCVALRDGLTEVLPSARRRRVVPERQTTMLILQADDRLLLEQRPAPGVWGGLWSLPECAPGLRAPAILKLCAERYGVKVVAQARQPLLTHGFTHFTLHIQPVRVAVAKAGTAPRDMRWFTRADALSAGIPAPVRKLLAAA